MLPGRPARAASGCYSRAMSILLVRHGETEGNAARIVQLPDSPLSPVGMSQAEQLAARIAELGATHILCSDLLRARMTAAPIAARLGLLAETNPLLQERNFGDLRGTPYAEFTTDPFAPDYVPVNGESWDVFHARVAEAFALVCARASETPGNLVVVTHGFVVHAIVARHVALTGDQRVPEKFSNTSLTVLDGAPPYRAQLIDCTSHLSPVEEQRANTSGAI